MRRLPDRLGRVVIDGVADAAAWTSKRFQFLPRLRH